MEHRVGTYNILCLSLNCGAVDRFATSISCLGGTIGFIGTAGDIYAEPTFVEDDKKRLRSMGYDVRDLDVSSMTATTFSEAIQDVDMLYVSGGNTYYLLQELRRTGVADALRDAVLDGKPYIGASAGAVVLTRDIGYIGALDDDTKAPLLEDRRGLGIISFSPLPHFGKPAHLDEYFAIVAAHLDAGVVLFQDDQAILTPDGIELTLFPSHAVDVQ